MLLIYHNKPHSTGGWEIEQTTAKIEHFLVFRRCISPAVWDAHPTYMHNFIIWKETRIYCSVFTVHCSLFAWLTRSQRMHYRIHIYVVYIFSVLLNIPPKICRQKMLSATANRTWMLTTERCTWVVHGKVPSALKTRTLADSIHEKEYCALLKRNNDDGASSRRWNNLYFSENLGTCIDFLMLRISTYGLMPVSVMCMWNRTYRVRKSSTTP